MCIIEYSMSSSWPVGQEVECKSVCFMLVKAITVLTFFTVPDMSPRQMLMWYYWYMSLSGFFTILAYLVLTMFPLHLYFHDHPHPKTYFLCFFLLLCKLFLTSCSLCIFLLSSFSLEIVFSMYVCGFL